MRTGSIGQYNPGAGTGGSAVLSSTNTISAGCLEALASKTIADAISKDGPTRRLLYRQDLMNLISKEQEIEYCPDEQKIVDIENEYGQLLHQWAEAGPKIREKMSRIISEALIDISNSRFRKGENHE